jgi:hypothetical protein
MLFANKFDIINIPKTITFTIYLFLIYKCSFCSFRY